MLHDRYYNHAWDTTFYWKERNLNVKIPPANAFPLHFSTCNFMFLKNKLGIVSLTYVSHTGCQQTAEQTCFAMYHLNHLVWDISLRKSWGSSQPMFRCCFVSIFPLGGEKWYMPCSQLSRELGHGQDAVQTSGNLEPNLKPPLPQCHFIPA